MTTDTAIPSLEDILVSHTVPGELYERLDDDKLQCVACGHRCKIPNGRAGVCKIRFNEDSVLKVPYGYAAALQCDSIEKNRFSMLRLTWKQLY